MKDKKWVYYDPVFESEQYNPMVLIYSPWAGHKRFAYDYIRFMEPSVIVELGSYYGCSAFAFLQAVKDGKTGSKFYAIDTWQGDDFTKNDYKEDIYTQYKRINDSCFADVDSVMVRSTFDEACPEFADESIDLLHIDGSHAYDDVKHDYLTWKDKVRPDGVIFFHDVGMDLLFGEEMGSHIFWEELKASEPFTMEMPFSNGLGILCKSESVYIQLKALFSVEVYQNYINLQDTINKDTVRKDYFKIRDLESYNKDLLSQLDTLKGHLNKYSDDSAAKQKYIEQLEAEKELLYSEKSGIISHINEQFGTLQVYAESKASYAEELEAQIDGLKKFISDKENYINELTGQVEVIKRFAEEKEAYIINLKEQLEQLDAFSQKKTEYALELENKMTELSTFAENKENYIDELLSQIKELNEFADGKDKYAEELEKRIFNLNTDYNGLSDKYEILRIEKEKADGQLALIKEKVKRIPFGKKLLEGIE